MEVGRGWISQASCQEEIPIGDQPGSCPDYLSLPYPPDSSLKPKTPGGQTLQSRAIHMTRAQDPGFQPCLKTTSAGKHSSISQPLKQRQHPPPQCSHTTPVSQPCSNQIRGCLALQVPRQGLKSNHKGLLRGRGPKHDWMQKDFAQVALPPAALLPPGLILESLWKTSASLPSHLPTGAAGWISVMELQWPC